MKINILKLKRAVGNQEKFEFVTSAEEIDLDGQNPWIGNEIKVEGEITNSGRLLTASGTIHATAKSPCDYCLEVFCTAMDIPFSAEFQDSMHGEADADADLICYTGDEISIAEVVREAMILAEPLRNVCKEDCSGLCPQCGVNLNSGTCSCSKENLDPRLAVLSKLLK